MDTIEELRIKSQKIRERIEQIEGELREPLMTNPDDSAAEEGTREVTYRLYQVEKENLAKIEADILELTY
jgi:RNA polymerase-binding transcription factor DksA